jgi:hypothetical protein
VSGEVIKLSEKKKSITEKDAFETGRKIYQVERQSGKDPQKALQDSHDVCDDSYSTEKLNQACKNGTYFEHGSSMRSKK